MSIEYYDIYESEYTFTDDIEFCSTLMSGQSVLEVGCGTGRVLSFLKAHGEYNLSGLDIDDKAIDIAKAKLKNVNLSVDDATTFEHNSIYDNILFLFNGLMHISDNRGQIDFLNNAYNHLGDGGNLIFYVSSPDIGRMSERFPYYKYQKTLNVNNILVDKYECNRYNLSEQLIHRIFNYDYTDETNNLKRITSRFTVRYFNKKELEVVLNSVGFKSVEFYGDFDGSDWSPESPSIIVKAIKYV
jgi:glycine/sarcosine N-methyltransferase